VLILTCTVSLYGQCRRVRESLRIGCVTGIHRIRPAYRIAVDGYGRWSGLIAYRNILRGSACAVGDCPSNAGSNVHRRPPRHSRGARVRRGPT